MKQDYNTANYYNTEEATRLLGIGLNALQKRIKSGKYKDIQECPCNKKNYLVSKKEVDKEVKTALNNLDKCNVDYL
jgi:hypothetical protein